MSILILGACKQKITMHRESINVKQLKQKRFQTKSWSHS